MSTELAAAAHRGVQYFFGLAFLLFASRVLVFLLAWLLATLRVLEKVTLATRFLDVTMVCEPVQRCAYQTLAAEHFGPTFDAQVRRHGLALPCIGRIDDVEQQF